MPRKATYSSTAKVKRKKLPTRSTTVRKAGTTSVGRPTRRTRPAPGSPTPTGGPMRKPRRPVGTSPKPGHASKGGKKVHHRAATLAKKHKKAAKARGMTKAQAVKFAAKKLRNRRRSK